MVSHLSFWSGSPDFEDFDQSLMKLSYQAITFVSKYKVPLASLLLGAYFLEEGKGLVFWDGLSFLSAVWCDPTFCRAVSHHERSGTPEDLGIL